MDDPASEATARTRWAIITLLRLIGVAMVVIGILIVNGTIAAPAMAGHALLAAGLVDTFAVPLLLARRWRSPRS